MSCNDCMKTCMEQFLECKNLYEKEGYNKYDTGYCACEKWFYVCVKDVLKEYSPQKNDKDLCSRGMVVSKKNKRRDEWIKRKRV